MKRFYIAVKTVFITKARHVIGSSWLKTKKDTVIKTYRLFGLQSQPNTGPGCLYFLTNVPSTILTILEEANEIIISKEWRVRNYFVSLHKGVNSKVNKS